ncbi:MAG: FAD-dependent oxidoreductase [Gammaproteobacteria bacterium]
MADDKKIGAYICKGCGLGERLEGAQLKMIAEREAKANVVKEHDFLCSEDGVAMIKKDIETEGVNRVAICACSRRAKTEAFNFDNVAMSRANLREGVIWVRPDTDEAREITEEMAADYVRITVWEVKYMTPPMPNAEAKYNSNVLVVGGGISGMTSAIEAAKAGYGVTIVEKSGALGGAAANFHKRIPDKSPYKDPMDTGVAEMIAAIEADKNITVHLNSRLSKTDGAPGRFDVEISAESGSTNSATFGAIVQASGFTGYDANKLPESIPPARFAGPWICCRPRKTPPARR